MPWQSCTARFMYDGNASVQNPSKSRPRLQSSHWYTRLWFVLTAPLMAVGLRNTVAATSTCSQQAEAAAWRTGAAVRGDRVRCPGRHVGPSCRTARNEVSAAVQSAFGSPRPPTCPLPPAALECYGQSECSSVKVKVHRQCQVADCSKSATSFSAAYQKTETCSLWSHSSSSHSKELSLWCLHIFRQRFHILRSCAHRLRAAATAGARPMLACSVHRSQGRDP